MMSTFPTDWVVLNLEEYQRFLADAMEDEGRCLHPILYLNDNFRSTDNFRFCLTGGGPVRVRVPLPAMILGLPSQLHTQSIEITCQLEDVSPEAGTTITRWTDLEELIRDGSTVVSDEDGTALPPTQILAILSTPGTAKSCLGASIRWAVAVGEDQATIRLELQGMPSQAKYLNKAQLKGENSVSVLLGAIPFFADTFDSPVISGPVPKFFANQPEQALRYITDHPDNVLADVADVNSRLLLMEHITLQEAYAYMQRKHRMAKGLPAFPTPRQPKPKRAKTTPAPGTETGRYLYFPDCL